MPEDIDTIILELTLKAVTPKAVLFGGIWIAKSQILNLPDLESYLIGNTYEVELPEWIALSKGII
jgi:hypothetical protein